MKPSRKEGGLDPNHNPGYLRHEALDHLAKFAVPLKSRIDKRLKIGVGDRVLDVGCGTGLDALLLARVVGDGGIVIGIDYDEELVASARLRAANTEESGRVGYLRADAGSIPFADGAFDACRCERLFQHCPDGARILSEMVRVTKNGGRIVVADTDWGTLSIDTPHVEIERRVVRSLAGVFLDGYAGRKLFGRMKEHRLEKIAIDVWTVIWKDFHEFRTTSLAVEDIERKIVHQGLVSASELNLFWESLEQAHQRGAFFASGSVVIVVGSKPAARNRKSPAARGARE